MPLWTSALAVLVSEQDLQNHSDQCTNSLHDDSLIFEAASFPFRCVQRSIMLFGPMMNIYYPHRCSQHCEA